jgi:hypothetical protein
MSLAHCLIVTFSRVMVQPHEARAPVHERFTSSTGSEIRAVQNMTDVLEEGA